MDTRLGLLLLIVQSGPWYQSPQRPLGVSIGHSRQVLCLFGPAPAGWGWFLQMSMVWAWFQGGLCPGPDLLVVVPLYLLLGGCLLRLTLVEVAVSGLFPGWAWCHRILWLGLALLVVASSNLLLRRLLALAY